MYVNRRQAPKRGNRQARRREWQQPSRTPFPKSARPLTASAPLAKEGAPPGGDYELTKKARTETPPPRTTSIIFLLSFFRARILGALLQLSRRAVLQLACNCAWRPPASVSLSASSSTILG